jgi:release factor glutamine methyltransferase
MTLREAILKAEAALAASEIPSPHPRMDAETLLLFALEREGDRAYLLAHAMDALEHLREQRYWGLVQERVTGKPIQYITGHQEFWGLDFVVSPAVLIPRPETEHAVEAVLEVVKHIPSSRDEKLRIVDVGTGSGAIAVAVAHALPEAEVAAVDLSADALRIARGNAERNGVQVRFVESDLLAALDGEVFDVVVSNPPYIGTDHPDTVQRQVRDFEPAMALWGGPRGVEIYQRLIPQAAAVLHPGGALVMEIGYRMEQEVRDLFPPEHWSDILTWPDLQGIPRTLIARRKA